MPFITLVASVACAAICLFVSAAPVLLQYRPTSLIVYVPVVLFDANVAWYSTVIAPVFVLVKLALPIEIDAVLPPRAVSDDVGAVLDVPM